MSICGARALDTPGALEPCARAGRVCLCGRAVEDELVGGEPASEDESCEGNT